MAKVLSVSVHADDSEYSIGGTLKLLADRGCDVTIVNTLPNGHGTEPAEILGCKKIILDYDYEKYAPGYKNNPESVKKVIEIIKDIKPDILFMMYGTDTHMDHVECAKTAREAQFLTGWDSYINEIYSVECGPFQTMRYFSPDAYVCIDSVSEYVKKSFDCFNAPYLWGEKEGAAKFRALEMATCCGNSPFARSVGLAETFKIEKFPIGSSDFLLRQILEDQFCWCSHRNYHVNAHPVFHS